MPETGSTRALAAPPRTTRAGPVQAPAVGDPHTVTRCRQESINRRGRSCLTTAHRGLHAEPCQMVSPELGRRKVVSSRRRRLLHGLDRGGGRKIRWGIEHQKAIRKGTRRRRWKRRILGGRRHPRCCRQERQQGLWRRRRGMVDGAFVRALRLCQSSGELGCPLDSLAFSYSILDTVFFPLRGRKGTWCQFLDDMIPTSFLRHNFR